MDGEYSVEKMPYTNFKAIMLKWLFIALLITTITSTMLSLINFIEIFEIGYLILLIVSSLLEIVFVILLALKLSKLSIKSAKRYFIIYSIINGITLSLWIQMVAPLASILAFGLTCAYFGLLYTIEKYTNFDFSPIGKICLSVLPILIIGYIILYFLQSSIMYYVIIFLDLIIFSGMTLYDLQKARIMYEEAEYHEVESAALLSALELYLDFINIFIDILSVIADGC
ncbi:Bax inhibitor-1 family protein [Candidatus Stoquefichus massiliensis]|uniref:Bax inhibitor-1 family protein n=1 Tax=Candidatus Stoquefichus massiliensis TaxID=1470350 RepID=UPI00048788EA|nr:Bax inhibitor-1 family protein [Candidatus Stoquefichus massiliensis]